MCRSGKEGGGGKTGDEIALDRGKKRKEVGPKQKEKKKAGGGTEVMWAAERRRRSNVKWRREASDTLDERLEKGGEFSFHSGCLEYL